MSRPPLAVGTYGSITTLETAPGRWRARANYRDHDGVTRRVERFGTTKTGAANRVRAALRERLHRDGDEDITPDTTVAVLAAVWVEEHPTVANVTPQTMEIYQRIIDKVIVPGLGNLRVRELTVGKADRFIASIPAPSNARSARIILGKMLGLAARRDAIPHNPMRDTRKPLQTPREVRALTVAELHQLREQVDAWAGGNRTGPPRGEDLAELVDVLAGTGVRFGEALALRWPDIDLDADVPTIKVRGTVVKVGGKYHRQDQTKTWSGRRTLAVPGFVVDALRRQQARDLPAEDGLVFPSAKGGVRSPDNERRKLRQVRGELGWVEPKSFRKTVATVIESVNGPDAAMLQLGHSDGTVLRMHYVDPRNRVVDNRNALDALAPQKGGLKGDRAVKSPAA